MGTSVIQPSFTGGELAPELYGRVDLARYQTSLRTLRNMISRHYGGVTNRPGFQYINEVKTSAKKTRLVPFQFSTVQTYVLEFGDQYIRFYKDGGRIESPPGTPVEIASPYLEADLFNLKFTQSADVLTITHNGYAPRQLTRTSHTAWTLTLFAFQNGPFQDINTVTTTTVTASAATGSGITLTASASIFAAAQVGALFYIGDARLDLVRPWAAGQQNSPAGNLVVGSLRRSDGKVYACTTVPAAPYRTGGNRPTHSEGKEWDGDSYNDASFNNGVEWEYRHSGFGIVKITAFTSGTSVTADVISRLPDSAVSANSYKWAFGAWGGDQGYPACVTYDQERQLFGATTAQPQSYWASKVGAYIDFGISTPVLDDDAISKSVPGRQVNAIRHIISLDKPVILTSGAEFVVFGEGENNVLTPTLIAKPQTYRGSAQVAPIVIGDMALYLQEKGSVVRDLGYRYENDAYSGDDLTVLSTHLFEGKSITDWAYTQVPWSVVWCVRSDGVLLGLTYFREQQVVGWHRHDTDGTFESVCSVSEGSEDALYAVVKRTINGTSKRYVERLHSRTFSKVEDGFFVDSGLTYDGRNQAGTVTLSGGSAWDQTETQTATLAGSTVSLAASHVGDQFILTDTADSSIKYRLTIEAVTSATVCTVRPNRLLPVDKRGSNSAWDLAAKDIGGLAHLEAKSVAILADGNVQDPKTVASGVVTLDVPGAVVHIGLPITADFETLDINVPGQETLRDKQKIIPTVRLVVKDSRGVLAGPDTAHLDELKQRDDENYDEPITPLTGLAEIRIDANWNKQGRFFVRQSDPLPVTILAAIPDLIASNA